MTKIAISNLTQREVLERLDDIAKAVIGVILNVPQLDLSKRDVSFTFPQALFQKTETVSVVISEESFFRKGMNLNVRLVVCRRVSAALKPILGKDGRNISVEIRRPK